ncbi:hypothetical protein RF11_05791 [Thelohanellus kitauei]|uniref:Tc1-like transposase DDE domain-containing protein n=1 Tax=Thelohanellus kitauei TaxID=669202 RepID=A0A0C2M9T1_THEKT|nr:hypothetical protein RF11_05791 [Thelohanellus kitauei]
MSDDTIYIDGTGFNLHLRRKFARAPSGKEGHNISVCTAMHSGGLFHFRARVRVYNADEFIQFLSEMFVKTGPGSKNLVMDNVRFHHIENVKRFVENRGHYYIFAPIFAAVKPNRAALFEMEKSRLIGHENFRF